MAEEEPTTISSRKDSRDLSPSADDFMPRNEGEHHSSNDKEESLPFHEIRTGERLGRYVIRRLLGKGSFGEVYLAHDESLLRPVALKVIHHGAFGDSEETLMEEGRTMAQLDHPGIVTVHDVGKTVDGRLYFVSKYIEGEPLSQYLKEHSLTPEEAAELVADVTAALDYAHARSVIHRDIKPGNILITSNRKPVLIDFGISLGSHGPKFGFHRAVMGTPSHMSPEQARGESHLVDERTDLYSLGVVLYEILTGKRPFEGRTEDLLEMVASPSLEALPPRQIDSNIPKAIERICLKALAKRTADRYPTAQQLASDLRSFIRSRKQDSDTRTLHSATVIPKGLRSFDENDSGFFLQLLPGLRDQAGIPDGIRFWERGILNSADPFRVGVLYGPSGSGKSSFLKAGLIPLLPDEIEVFYVTADRRELEKNILERLCTFFPDLCPEDSLSESIRRLREERLVPKDGKVLIVIDQFEQWLHRHGKSSNADLVSALRQCDGKTVQVLLTLRDDFWMAIGYFMEEIDADLLQSKNAAAIDLFERKHATEVLMAFGRAYERFPQEEAPLSEDQQFFIDSTLSDLEEDGKIIPLRLALFAEMAKGIEWTRESYQKYGGAQAIGVEFLDRAFSRRTANPAHRAVEKEARVILEALLPDGGESIRGQPLTEEEIVRRSVEPLGPERFSQTMAILDGELRLVTPADAQALGEKSEARHYQLTHDYLVPSLRDWLHESRSTTRSGRCYLRLKELSSAWKKSRDPRHLPHFFEWAQMRFLISKDQCDDDDRKLLQLCDRRYGLKIAVFSGFALLLGGLFSYINHAAQVKARADRILSFPPSEHSGPKEQANSDIRLLPHVIESRLNSGELTEYQETNARLLLLAEGETEHSGPLFASLNQAAIEHCRPIVDSLLSSADHFTPLVWNQIENPEIQSEEKLRLSVFLACCDPENPEWSKYKEDINHWLLMAPENEVSSWAELLKPLGPKLLPPLQERIARARSSNSPTTSLDHKAVLAAIELAEDHIPTLLGLLEFTPESELNHVASRLQSIGSPAVDALEKTLDTLSTISGESPNEVRDRQARAGAALLRTNHRETVWEWFGGARDPGVQARLIHLVPACGVDPEIILEKIKSENEREVQIGLLQTLGEYDTTVFSREFWAEATKNLKELYESVPDPGIHYSVRWTLTRWGESLPHQSTTSLPPESRPWMEDSMGQHFAVIEIPGKPKFVNHFANRFGISVFETTYQNIAPLDIVLRDPLGFSTSPELPVCNISMDDAMRICNAMSEKEGIPEEEWCYHPKKTGKKSRLTHYPDFVLRTGYRLPTEDEWIFLATADFGQQDLFPLLGDSIHRYSSPSGTGKTIPPGLQRPNRFGLHDLFGNCTEWCHPLFQIDMYGVECGSSIHSLIQHIGPNSRYRSMIENFSPDAGMRVARTIREK